MIQDMEFVDNLSDSAPRSATSWRPWYRVAMHWIRRLHLYSGLFMFPWVMLYGVTALLFNHPGAFPDQQQTAFGTVEIQGTTLEGLPKAEELAHEVVATLEKKSMMSKQVGSSYLLVEPEKAAFSRDVAFARVNAEGQQHTIRIEVSDGTGRISTRGAAEPVEKAPFAQRGLKVEGSFPERIKEAIPTVLERSGIPTGDVTITASPELTFLMDFEGKRWQVTYNTLTGGISGRPAEEAARNLSTRTFLLRMHLAHGFPSSMSARWFWAIAVDVMFVSMVFWGMSGILMFWQIKAVRGWGMILLLVSATIATVLAFAMHREL